MDGMTMKRLMAVFASVALAAAVQAEPAAEWTLRRGSRALWDAKALNRMPRTFPVTIPCSNSCGRVEGVEPIFVEGEPWRGKPTRVFAWWGLPKGADEGRKVPAMVLVHGGGGTAFATWVKTWNDRGYAAIAMDTCGGIPQGERDGRSHPRHEWSGPSGWGGSVAQIGEPIGDQWTYHAVAAVMRCHSFLRSRPEVDPDRVGLTGISWGGYLTSIVGSVDDRFRFAAPVYGCGYYEWNPEWHHMDKDREKLRAWFALWDPKNFFDSPEGGAKIPYLWCCGTNDRWYPLDAVRMSCNLLDRTVPLNLSLKHRMPHGHPPAGDPKEISAYADAFLKDGRPLVDITHAWLEKDALRVEFDAHGRQAVRAEVLYTCSTNALLMDRAWTVGKVADFDARGRLSAPVPADAVMFFANVVTDDGLVASTRIFQREEWGLVDHPRNPATDWMVGGCGAFAHYLLDKKTFARVGEFDVAGLAKQIADMKPDWFCLTLGQNSGYLCSPNATYERICGYEPGSRCSTRDIPAELIAALKPLGVKFMLYLPCQSPNADRSAAEAFGFTPGAKDARPHDREINAVAARRWAEVIEEWSRRYGKDVAGWWFDGGYRRIRFSDEIADLYAAAVKRGNPDAVVAFNEGVRSPMRRWTLAGDYLAGEINEPFRETCGGRWFDDRQWQLLTFAGSSWAKRDCRFADEQWISWMHPILKKGGAVTIDLAIDCPTGRLEPAQAAQLKRIFSAVR